MKSFMDSLGRPSLVSLGDRNLAVAVYADAISQIGELDVSAHVSVLKEGVQRVRIDYFVEAPVELVRGRAFPLGDRIENAAARR